MLTQPATIIKHATLTGAILFQTEGYVPITNESYEDSKISFVFALPTEKIQLIPKYLSNENCLVLTIDHEQQLIIGAIVKGVEKIYGRVNIAGNLTAQNTLVITSTDANFVVSINGTNVFKFQSALFIKGSVRVTGAVDEIFYSVHVEEPQSSVWVSNATSAKVEAKKIEINDTAYMKLTGSSTRSATLRERVAIGTGSYALSFSAVGTGTLTVKKTDATLIYSAEISLTSLENQLVFFTSALAESVDITFSTATSLTVGKVQLETGDKGSPYIENTSATLPAKREGSSLRLPIKEIFDTQSGSVYAKFRTLGAITELQKLIASDDINFFCAVGEGKIYFTMGAAAMNMPFTMEANSEYAIIASWNGNNIRITANESTMTAPKKSLNGLSPKEFIFAGEDMIQEGIVLEEFALFNNAIASVEEIERELPNAQMHGLFEGGISGKNVTWSEIPVAPHDHSPILVQKKDGQTLRKVSFFDYETGKYRTWNEESFVYDGKSDFVEVAYQDLNEDFRDIAIRTAEGEKVGAPYTIEGKRFYFSLYDNQKILYKNQELFATYQVNDTYTVDYNIEAVDGFRIDFAKHDGQDRVVYQEGNRYGESKKLATMIDMNPIQNQNHEGFLYITKTINKTESFRITATPDRLHADGSSLATIVIEPLDHQGNFLTHANVEVTAERGFMTRHIQKDAVEAQKRSGQYLYQYVAPYIQSKINGEVIEDTIWIVDKDNNIGVSYKILLSPVTKSTGGRMTATEKALLTKKTQMIHYLLRYEGVEKFEAEALVALLDLDGDGRITMNEVTVLENKKRDGELTNILKEVQKWEVQ